jgi:hypothetical protein
VYSLGLNNPPRICLTPRKSGIKNLCLKKQGNCRCKMAGAGIRSNAKFRSQMPRIATTGITSWQTISTGLRISKFRAQVGAVKSSLWQSALKFILLSVAIQATVILFLAIRILNAAIATIRGTHLTMELGKRLNSSSHHFTSRVPCLKHHIF